MMDKRNIESLRRRRLDRLLRMVACVRDCSRAIPFLYNKHRELFEHMTHRSHITDKIDRMVEWSYSFLSVEERIMADLSVMKDEDGCPEISRRKCPNMFEVTDTLYRIGYYQVNAPNIYWQEVFNSKQMVIAQINQLNRFVFMAMNALACAVYTGKWQMWGDLFIDFFNTIQQNNKFIFYEKDE